MKKQQLYKLSILVAIATITLGCKQPTTEASKPVASNTPPPVVASQETTLATLKSSGVTTLGLESTSKTYKSGTPIQFKVNTMGNSGYLYIIYLDKSGETMLLYPNANSPLTELSGDYVFPRDFGNIDIRATKDCKGCKEDKTTIYAILTKEPVTDIKNITKAHLLKFSGEKKAQSKGLKMNLNEENSGGDTNINVGKIEFTVQ